jgi:CelD/BcsL family acetyltransferase involved in cellulose biosynthesis
MTEICLIDPIEDREWLFLLEGSASGQVFHHPAWLSLLREQYGYEFRACCVRADGALRAGLPIAWIKSRLTGRRLVSLPFSDVCSPLIAPESGAQEEAELGRALSRLAADAGLPLTVHGPLSAPGATTDLRFVQHLLPLAESPSEVEKRYAKSQVKRGIRRAEREGLTSERRTDAAALDAFYALHLRTRRRLGVPTQPKRFILRFEQLFAAGLGFVQLVLDDGSPIAAAVFLTHGKTVTYKYGASDSRSLPKRPNNLLFSEVIRWACAAGFQTLDFGRTELQNDGLRSFKKAWGASEAVLPYSQLAEGGPARQSALRDRVMTTSIRRSPAFVGRVMGEALYGHFG